MKKIISIVLSIALLASTLVMSFPSIISAESEVSWIADSVFSSPNTAGGSIWLGVDDLAKNSLTATEVTKNSILFNEYKGISNIASTNFLSAPILSYNSVDNTNVADFEWSFKEYGLSTGWRRPDTLNVYFFHVGEESNCEAVFNYNYYDGKTVGFKDIKDCFAIAYAYNATEDGLAGWAFTVLQPTYDTDGTYLGLRPIKYTESDGVITPDASSYLAVYEGSRTGTADADTNKKIVDNYFQQKFTKDIKIALKGNQLTLEYLCTGTSTTLSGAKTFTLSSDALAKAPSGDFAISHNRDWDTSSADDGSLSSEEKAATVSYVCGYGNMTIDALYKEESNNVVWNTAKAFSSPSESGGPMWLGANDVAKNTLIGGELVKSNVLFNEYKGTTNFLSEPILDYNKHGVNTGVGNVTETDLADFEWTFKEYGKSTTWRRRDTLNVYFFHVTDDSNCEAVFNYNSYDGNTVGLKDVKDCFAIAYAYKATDDGLAAQAFTVLQPTYDKDNNYLGLRPIRYTEVNGVITPSKSAYLAVANNSLSQEVVKDISITLKGNILTLKYVCGSVSDSKSFILSSDALSKASSGDFVIHHNRDWDPSSNEDGTMSDEDKATSVSPVCGYGNMTINALLTAVTRTQGLTFEKSSSSSGGRVTLQDGRAVISGMRWDSNKENLATAWLTTKGITGKQLSDYTIKFNYVPSSTRWNVDAVALRIQDSSNPNREEGYSLVIQGTSFKVDGVAPTGSIISIQKDRCNSVTTENIDENTMSMKKLDAPLTVGAEYIVEVKVNGGSIKVWLYRATANKPLLPTITYTDSQAKYTTGDVAFVSSDAGFSVADISISDSVLGTVCENWCPEYYNSKKLNKAKLVDAEIKVGTVFTSEGKLTVKTNNSITNDIYPVALNNISTKELEVFNLDMVIYFSAKAENEASINFGGYKLSFVNSVSGDKAVLYRNGEQLTASETNFRVGQEYAINIAKNNGSIILTLYEAGGEKPNASLINVIDNDWLAGGNVWLSTENGEWTVCDIKLIEGVSAENSAVNNSHTVIGASSLRFEKSTNDGGIVTLMGTRAVITGMKWDSQNNKYISTFVTSKGITGKNLSDYTLKFNYIPASTTWNVDAVALRVQDSDNPNRTQGYSLVIQGTSTKVDGKNPVGSIVSIQKDSCNAISTMNLDSNKIAFTALDAPLNIGAEYIVEVEVKSGSVKVWIYEANSEKPTIETVSYSDPDNAYIKGDIAFVSRDEGYTVSDVTVVDSVFGTVSKNWKPTIYNNSQILNSNNLFTVPYESGVISVNNNGYRIISGNTVTDTVYKAETNGLTQNEDVYIQNFELCYEVSFNEAKNNIAVTSFSARDYTDEKYSLTFDANGYATLTKGANELKKVAFKFITGVKYQVVVNVNNGTINIDIYRLADLRPSNHTISYKDVSPLHSGYITFSTYQGDYNVDKIVIKSFDDSNIKGPTGIIFQKDFEGNDYNLNGLALSRNNTENTTLSTDYDGNKFLRIVGKPNAASKAGDISGTDALSVLQFGSQELYNFDFTADVRFKSALSANWSYLAAGCHSSPSALMNQTIWLNSAPRGCTVVKLDAKNGLNSNNLVATTGMVTGTNQTPIIPNDAQKNGMPVDGRWHKLSVSVRGNTYSLYIDGELKISYTDPDHLYKKGAFYLYGYGINYDIDNIVLENKAKESSDAKTVNNIVYSNDAGFKLKEHQKTSELVGKDIAEFEIEFEYKAASSEWGRTAFLYRVTDKTSVKNAGSSYSNISNACGFTIMGANQGANISHLHTNGITAFSPSTDAETIGKIFPVLYTQEKDENGKAIGPVVPSRYIDFATVYDGNSNNVATAGIDVSKWMTVNARFIGNKLIVTVWQSGNKAKTMRISTFTVPQASLGVAEAGDFMIVNGNNGAEIRNIKIRDIS